jgi:hypothetical protein
MLDICTSKYSWEIKMILKSRRNLIKTLMLSASMTLLNHTALASSNYANDDGLTYWETMQAEQLQSLVGQNFWFYGPGSSCEAELKSVRVTHDPNRPASFARKHSFSAELEMVGYDCLKGDGIVTVSHPEVLGNGNLFVMAKSFGEDVWHLEIVFN